MNPAVSCAAAGEDRPVKGADIGLLDVSMVTGEVDQEFLKFTDEKKDVHKDDGSVITIQVSYPSVSVEKEILIALFGYKDVSVINLQESYGAVSFEKPGDLFHQFEAERKVIHWNAKDWISLREVKKSSQSTKGGIAAAKKGLGYFCYGSYGAYRGKF